MRKLVEVGEIDSESVELRAVAKMLVRIESRTMPSQANNPNPSPAVVARDADIEALDSLLHRIRFGLSVLGLKPRVEFDDDLGGRDESESEVEIAISFRTRVADVEYDLRQVGRVIAGVVGQ